MLLEKYTKFRESVVGLLLLTVVSVIAGLGLLLTPELTPKFLIRAIGILWILDGVSYTSSLLVKHIEYRIKSKTKGHDNDNR